MKYTITANYNDNGQTCHCTTYEVMGDQMGQTFTTREEAQSVADMLQREVAQYGLDASTRYEVVEA